MLIGYGHVMVKEADVVAVDLPWGGAVGRTALAYRSGAGIGVMVLSGADELSSVIAGVAARSALVLLDAPLDGLNALTAEDSFRAVDRRLARCSIPILPSFKAGNIGPTWRTRFLQRRPDLRIREIYPYAVLRVLWAHHTSNCGRFSFENDASCIDLSPGWTSSWPPKYKRARTVSDRRGEMRRVADMLRAVPGFGSAVGSPSGLAGRDLVSLADQYDALLGLVAGIAAVDASSWSWEAESTGSDNNRAGGAILSISDSSLRREFERRASQ